MQANVGVSARARTCLQLPFVLFWTILNRASFPPGCTVASAASGWCASCARSYTPLLKVRRLFQMLTSLTSVGVQDRSASPDTRFGSALPLWCWACCKLDTRRDSICSWQARKQSCETHSSVWITVTSRFRCIRGTSAYRVAANDLR